MGLPARACVDGWGGSVIALLIRSSAHETLYFLIALHAAVGALVVSGHVPAGSPVTGPVLLLLAGVLAMRLTRARADPARLPWVDVTAGAAGLLLIAFELRPGAPAMAMAYGTAGLALAMLMVLRHFVPSTRASGLLFAIGASLIAHGAFYFAGGAIPRVGMFSGAAWYADALTAGLLLTGALLVLVELRSSRPTLAPGAATIVILLTLLVDAVGTRSWAGVALYGLQATLLCATLWVRLPHTIGSRIVSGLGAVALLSLALVSALTVSLDRGVTLLAHASDVGFSPADLSVRLAELRAAVTVGTITVAVAAVALAVVLSRSIGERMKRLTAATTSVASGHPYAGHIVTRDDGDDLDELARAFELMRARIAAQAAGLVALAQAESQRALELSSVLDASEEVAIIAIDTAGLVTTFNTGAEKMLGWTAGEMLGTVGLPKILDGEEVVARARALGIPAGPDVIVGLARSGTVDHQTWSYIRKDGTRLPVDVAVSPRYDPRRELIGFLGIARDLTAQVASNAALVAAKEAAESADRTKSAFLADMSHELRTPMNAILGFSDLLNEQLGPVLSDRQRHFFANIHVAGEHLLGLINDVLDLSRVEAGRLDMRPGVIDIGALFEPATVAAKAAADRAGITFRCTASATGLVRVDAARTRQILFNLFSNAVKFTPAPGLVELDASFDGDALVIRVSDSGIGIPASEASRVFGVFERVNRDRSEAAGTGLGLALTKRLVELHGGTITFESVVGRGTTFTVVLPDARYRLLDSETVLVVEDEPADAELIGAIVTQAGFATHRVSTLTEAYEAVRNVRPLAVILDLYVPDGHGAAILETLRASEETKDVPVLVLTSATETVRFQLMGAECMTKPIDSARVRRWLRQVAPPISPEVAA